MSRGSAILAALVVIAASLTLAGCSRGRSAASDAYGERSAVTENGTAVTVDLKDLQFSPKGIKIRPGTTVTWVNNDAVAHNVSQIQSVFLSPDEMQPGQRFSFTFQTPGTYRYQCTFHHPNMNGVVIVEG